MQPMLGQIRTRVGRRGFAAAGGALVMLAAVALTPPLLGTRAADALDMLGAADARWLWAAGAGFALSVVAAAGSWGARSGSAAAGSA